MNTPQRIQRKRTKGWKNPANTVYVGRGTPYGNPFKVVSFGKKWRVVTEPSPVNSLILYINCESEYDTKQQAQAAAVRCYEIKISPSENAGKYAKMYAELLSDEIRENLKGKNLSCWCAPGDPCHADVLLKIANAEQ